MKIDAMPPAMPPWCDPLKRRLENGKRLRPTEWMLLALLWRRRGQVTTWDQMYTWLYADRIGDTPAPQTLKVWIHHLRRSLVGLPVEIDTLWCRGVMLSESEAAAA